MKYKKGTVFQYLGTGKNAPGHNIGIVLSKVQVAWGAEKYKVMFSNGVIGYIWDKNIKIIEVVNENPR